MSAETVIKKIQDKAAAEAEAIMNAGNAEAEALRASIMGEAQKKADEITNRNKAQTDMLLKGSRQQAELDNRISYLNYQHELLANTKEAAKKEMAKYDDKKWGALYTKLVSEYAMNGNVTIQVAPQDMKKFTNKDFAKSAFGDKGLLTEYWAKKLSKERGEDVSFTVCDEPADIEGGIILCGENYDIDLSYDAVLDEVFEQNEKEIADCLFGTKASGR